MLQINDIRYDIFHLVMVYLYNGGSRPLRPQVEAGDVLELMAAANFFQLPGILRTSMKRCPSRALDSPHSLLPEQPSVVPPKATGSKTWLRTTYANFDCAFVKDALVFVYQKI